MFSFLHTGTGPAAESEKAVKMKKASVKRMGILVHGAPGIVTAGSSELDV